MNRRRTGAIALAVALSMTACGAGDTGLDNPVGRPADDGPIPVEPDGGIGDGAGPADPGPDPQTARVVEPHPGGTDGTRARPWDRVVPNEDQTELTVFWSSGVAPCTVLDRVDVEETEDTVTITVYEGSDPANPDAMCIQIAEYKAHTVELSGELGPRSIVDGAERE